MKTAVLENDNSRLFYRKLFTIALPIAGQQLLTSLVSASDALMLGLVGQDFLSAISLATQIQFVLSLFQAAFMIGASVLAAQYWGIRDTKTVEQVLGLSLRVSIPVSLVFSLAALFFPKTLMLAFTKDTKLVAYGASYLRVVSPSYLLMGFSQMYLNIMKNSGRVGKSAAFNSAAVASNIVLNFILIFGLLGAPVLGITGAAVATVISRVIEVFLCILEDRRQDQVRFRIRNVLFADPELKKAYRKHMTPVLANEIAWGLGSTMFSVVMGHLGSDAVAANSVTNIIRNIALSFCVGLGSGSGIMIGNLLGAGELDEAKRTSHRLIRAGILFGAIAGFAVAALTPVFLHFSGNLTETARGYMKWMLLISAYYLIGRSLNGVLVEGTFCAGGDTTFGFLCDLINMWCIIIPLACLAAFVWKLPVMAVYFILNLDEMTKIPVEIAHYRKYKWLRNLTKSK